MNAFRQLEKVLGRKIDAVLCGEAGGINSTTPFVVAAASGLPLVDGDGMGRAYPELQMETFGLHGVSATPMVLCDDKGNSLVLETVNNAWTERLARAATVEMGGSALLAFYPMSGEAPRNPWCAARPRFVSPLGRLCGRRAWPIRIQWRPLPGCVGASVIFNGRVRDVDRRTAGRLCPRPRSFRRAGRLEGFTR